MKRIIIILVCTFLSFSIYGQNIMGAWETSFTSEEGEPMRSVAVFADGYQVLTTYNASTGKFIHTTGGSWELDGDNLTKKVEFDSNDPQLVGTVKSLKIQIDDKEMVLSDSDNKYKRIDDGSPGKLQGAWLMSGRVRDGETQLRDINRPRKTMKILSGTRFQWIAYNTETKQFMGTGGGTYTADTNEYTENIEFFSRDDSKAGLSLKFNYEMIDGNWHHKGFSSKGDPMHEIWSVRK
jgi:hypothetical protein